MNSFSDNSFQHISVPGVHTQALVESICPKCHRSLGTATRESVLLIIERVHKCPCEADA